VAYLLVSLGQECWCGAACRVVEPMRGWHVAWGFNLGGGEDEVMGCGPQ